MSRSGYSDDYDSDYPIALWHSAVDSAIRGRRGQKLIRELIAGLDAMEKKELIAGHLEEDGEYCALGVVGKTRGLDMSKMDPHWSEDVARKFDIANALACEVAYVNDEARFAPWGSPPETPAERWARMRAWAVEKLLPDPK